MLLIKNKLININQLETNSLPPIATTKKIQNSKPKLISV